MLKIKEINSDTVKSALRDVLIVYVGHGKQFSTDQLSKITGIASTTITAYKNGEISISVHNLLKLVAAMENPALINYFLSLIGYGGAHVIDGESLPLEQLTFEISKTLTCILGHVRDGRIGHDGKQQQKERLENLVSLIQAYAKTL